MLKEFLKKKNMNSKYYLYLLTDSIKRSLKQMFRWRIESVYTMISKYQEGEFRDLYTVLLQLPIFYTSFPYVLWFISIQKASLI